MVQQTTTRIDGEPARTADTLVEIIGQTLLGMGAAATPEQAQRRAAITLAEALPAFAATLDAQAPAAKAELERCIDGVRMEIARRAKAARQAISAERATQGGAATAAAARPTPEPEPAHPWWEGARPTPEQHLAGVFALEAIGTAKSVQAAVAAIRADLDALAAAGADQRRVNDVSDALNSLTMDAAQFGAELGALVPRYFSSTQLYRRVVRWGTLAPEVGMRLTAADLRDDLRDHDDHY